MYSLLLLIVSCSASVLKVELLRDLVDSGTSEEAFYGGLNISFGNSYLVGYSPYKYDPRCLSVHRTNSLLYVGVNYPDDVVHRWPMSSIETFLVKKLFYAIRSMKNIIRTCDTLNLVSRVLIFSLMDRLVEIA